MDDVAAARWLADPGTGPDPGADAEAGRLLTFGPAGFEAYARLRFIPDPDGPGLAEADAVVPEDHPSDLEQARIVLRALAADTPAGGRCFYCVWDGYGTLDAELARGPALVLPHRQYVLFSGEAGDIERWKDEFGGGEPCPPPAFVWPADHRWCFASDVDPHWAGIGASAAAIDALTARTDVDVVRASRDRPAPAYTG